MSTLSAVLTDDPVPRARDARQRAFVARLPRIESLARAAFRHLRCPHDRDDTVAEVVARAGERFRLLPGPRPGAADRLGARAVAAVRARLAPARTGTPGC